MISAYTYRYFLIFITIFALYQLCFFYLIRPYYAKKIYDSKKSTVKTPEVAFEVLYLLILILGLAVAPLVNITPYLLWGIVFLVYGLAIKNSKQVFFLASALFFQYHRKRHIKEQLKYEKNVIFVLCLSSAGLFLFLSYFNLH